MNSYDGSILKFIDDNQIPFSRNLLILLYLLHFTNPSTKHITEKFLHLQYESGKDENGQPLYDIGLNDIYIVIYWVVMFTFLRSFLMKWLWGPFGGYVLKMGQKSKIRFAEQSWSFYCCTISFVCGMLVYYYSPYWGDLDNVFKHWPHDNMSQYFKAYYLVELGFWLQQIFVLNIEEKRKDFLQMLSHHIITCCLLIGSYYYYYIRIGNLILVLMDCSDIFLTGAKLLKYGGFNFLCDLTFILFLVSWIVCRHGLYNYLFYHAWHNALDLMADAKCVEGVVTKRCWSPLVVNTFYSLLAGLQLITIIWMYFILKVAYKVISGTGAEDVRSDSEDNDEEEEQPKKEEEDKKQTKTDKMQEKEKPTTVEKKSNGTLNSAKEKIK